MSTPIGALVKRRREALILSQSDLAWLARVSRGTVGNIERGATSSASRSLVSVIEALGLHYLESANTFEEVENIPLFVTRKLIDTILERRDGSHRLKASRTLARSEADEYIRLVGMYEDDEVLDGEGKRALASVAEFVVPLLYSKSPTDRRVLEWFYDQGWSEDDYDDWEGLASDLVMNEFAIYREAPEPDAVSAQEAPASQEASAFDVVSDGLSDLRESVETLNRRLEMQQAFQAEQLRTFDRLPVKLQSVLSKGHVTDWSHDEIPGGVAAHIFMRREETDVDPVYTLLAIKHWESLQSVAKTAYMLLEERGADALADPLAAFEAMESALLSRASDPDILEALEEKFPGRLAEIRSRWPEMGEYRNATKEEPDGEAE